MKLTLILLLSSLLHFSACSSTNIPNTSREEARAASAKLDHSYNCPNSWYNDGIYCDDYCVYPDPDCAGNQPLCVSKDECRAGESCNAEDVCLNKQSCEGQNCATVCAGFCLPSSPSSAPPSPCSEKTPEECAASPECVSNDKKGTGLYCEDITSVECDVCIAPMVCGGAGVPSECGIPCTPVQTIFFDLGDTLVVSDSNGIFSERPGIRSVLEQLDQKGFQLGVITNTPVGWTQAKLESIINSPGLLALFDVVLLSSEAQADAKPSVAIFEEAQNLLPLSHAIEQSIFVTESLRDIANQELAPTLGARAAGMRTVFLSTGEPNSFSDYTIAPNNMEQILVLADQEWLCAAP